MDCIYSDLSWTGFPLINMNTENKHTASLIRSIISITMRLKESNRSIEPNDFLLILIHLYDLQEEMRVNLWVLTGDSKRIYH